MTPMLCQVTSSARQQQVDATDQPAAGEAGDGSDPSSPGVTTGASEPPVTVTQSVEPRAEPLDIDRAVPVRKRASVDGAPLRAAFLLSHVDNRMSVKQLAECARIPLADAIECFELLV